MIRPQTDLAFVMGFDVTSYVTQNYTNDQDKLEAGITKLRPGGGPLSTTPYTLPAGISCSRRRSRLKDPCEGSDRHFGWRR